MIKCPKYLTILLIAVFIFSTITAGCSQTATEETEATASSGEDVVAEVTEVVEVKEETSVEKAEQEPVIVLQGVESTTLDPHFISNTPQMNILFHIFDTLTRVDIATGEVLPNMADSWEVIDDTTWRFYLRQDITFQNGEAFNAEVVKYNLDRLIDPDINAYKWFFVSDADYKSSEVIDDYTIDIHTNSASAVVADALQNLLIVPMEYYSTTPLEELAVKPIGSGAYQMTEWVADDHLTVERWDDYWGEMSTIKTIIFRPVPELSTRISELVSGGADLIVNVAPDQTGQIESCEFCEIRGSSGTRDIFIMIDLRFEPFGEVKARQALNYAVDKQAILDAFFKSNGSILAGVANGYWENTNLEPYPYNPEKALELFAEIGYTPGADGKLQKDGKTIKLTMNTSNGRYMKDKEVAQAVAADLNKIGLDVTVEPLEWSVLSSKSYEGILAPLTLRGLGGFANGVAEMRWITPEPQYNMELDREIRWQNQEFEDILTKARAEMDTDKRKEMMDKLQAIAFEECPWIFLYKQYDYYGVNQRLVDWQPRANEYVLLFGDLTVEATR